MTFSAVAEDQIFLKASSAAKARFLAVISYCGEVRGRKSKEWKKVGAVREI